MRIDSIPILALFAGTIVVVMIAIHAGYRLAQVMRRQSEDDKESPASTITDAILGLSAFMLAITFGIVADRQFATRALVRDDAAAIGAAWRRSDFLPETDRAEAAALLRQYVDMRLKFAEASGLGGLDPGPLKSFLAEAQRLRDRLWNMAVVNARKDMNSDVAALYIESLNEVDRVHDSRVAIATQARIPDVLWFVLYCVTLLGMVSLGYQTRIAGAKRSMARPLVAVAFALVLALNALLDRPDAGAMKVTQRPLIDLRDSMSAATDRARRE